MSQLDEIAARTDAATEGPWRALGTGSAGGDHWYICDDGEAIASISCQDGINEEQRQPDAEFIAHAREDVPRLVSALRAVEAVLVDWDKFGKQCLVRADPSSGLPDAERAHQQEMAEDCARDAHRIRTAITKALG
ncbi:hypothetical protein [Arthrobacter sp. GMC3]|uniref:hypothetical protein n=1 Tax=Arthrobacter sp. GMC3 TaxID=2058894 RepID=UPI000CE372CA|nr:hypothetical protein [Arthrobacter sp. GMC3]